MSSYPPPPFDALCFWGMVAITLAVVPAGAWVFSAGQPARMWRWLVAAIAVMSIGAGLAISGLLARSDIRPPLAPMLLALLFPAVLLHAARAARQPGSAGVSLASLVLLQAFRLPLELLMLHAAHVGVMPIAFSMIGYNPDVTTGATAALLGWRLLRGRAVSGAWLWAWNLWGIACLVNIAVLAVLTAPNVAYLGQAPSQISLWVLRFPYVWLPTVLVSTAAYGHVWLTVRLLTCSPHELARHRTGSTSRSA